MTSPDSSTPPSGTPRSSHRAESSVPDSAPIDWGIEPPSPVPPSPTGQPIGTSWSAGPHPTVAEHAAALTSALSVLAEQMQYLQEGAEHLTCSETEAIIDVLVLSGHTEAASALRDGHAGGDEDPGDQHHARWHGLYEHDDERIAACCGDDGGDDLTEAIKEGRR
jgi:hypothetical protein